MLGEIADRLLRGFEKEAQDLVNQHGQQKAKFRANFFKTICHRFAGGK